MYRTKIEELKGWKNKENRKPLLINGARQIGKSWLVKHFGTEHFTGKTIIVNFDLQKDIHHIFDKNLDAKRIIFELEIALNTAINVETDLVFFDEIQACPNALASLRYFYEDYTELYLIAAGSLLDFEFRNVPFPVGRVDIMAMFPMTFYEYLLAMEKDKLAQLIQAPVEEFDESYAQFFEEELNLYFIIGGMPEAVADFKKNKNLENVKSIQNNLLYTYEQDFKKYQPTVNSDCLDDILENIIKLLGNQIVYTKLSDGFTSPTIKKGVEVLKTAKILHSVPNVSVSGLPLTKAGKQFKLFYLDIGLLVRKSGIDYSNLYIKKELTAAFQGALAEQFVMQQLIAKKDVDPKYWARTDKGTSSEIDFVMVENGKIVPIEVKAGKSGSLKSLHYILEHNPHIEKAIVYSNARLGQEGKVHYIPMIFAGR